MQKKYYAVQTRNKHHSTKWNDYADILDTEKEGRAKFTQQLIDNRNPYFPNEDKIITRLVSFIVIDDSVAWRDRPNQGCIILEVLEYHEEK